MAHEAVQKMAPAQHTPPVFLGFHQFTDWTVVPGGGIEPPTRGFSIELVVDYFFITAIKRDVILVCVKMCFWLFMQFGPNTVSTTNGGTQSSKSKEACQ